VSIGGLSLQLSESAVNRMKAAEDKADAANAKADAADARADIAEEQARDARRERDQDRALLDALRHEFDQLVSRIAACEAGHFCPVADALTRGPRSGGTE
jgi:hypothetical protein